MNLSELKKVALVDDGYVSKTLNWTDKKGDKYTFDVELKRNMSAADFEFIQFGPDPQPKRDKNGNIVKDKQGNVQYQTDDEESKLARRACRMIRFEDGEHLTYDEAKRLDVGLLFILINAQGAVENPVPKEDEVKNG